MRDPQAGLKVEVKTDGDEKKPGESVRAEVYVRNASQKAAKSQVTFLAVDERVLSAAKGQNSYDLTETFYKERPLTLINSDSRTQVVGQRHYGAKGDDASGGGGLGDALRREFHPAVYWLAQAQTDENGRMEVSFKLPDSLTAYRLVAIAADKGGNFGMGRAEVRASRSLQILSALPRFAIKGDKFQARVVVQNLGKKTGMVDIKAECQGIVLAGPAQQSLSLAPGQSRVIGFAVEAAAVGRATFTVRAVMGDVSDAALFSFPVLPQTDLVAATAAGSLNPSEETNCQSAAHAAARRPARTRVVESERIAVFGGGPGPAPGFSGRLSLGLLEQRISKAVARAFCLGQGRAWGFKAGPDDEKYATGLFSQAANIRYPRAGSPSGGACTGRTPCSPLMCSPPPGRRPESAWPWTRR